VEWGRLLKELDHLYRSLNIIRVIFFSLFRNQQSEYQVLYELMCWLTNYRGEVPSSEEISVVDSISVD
jgi:hypothetical protein